MRLSGHSPVADAVLWQRAADLRKSNGDWAAWMLVMGQADRASAQDLRADYATALDLGLCILAQMRGFDALETADLRAP